MISKNKTHSSKIEKKQWCTVSVVFEQRGLDPQLVHQLLIEAARTNTTQHNATSQAVRRVRFGRGLRTAHHTTYYAQHKAHPRHAAAMFGLTTSSWRTPRQRRTCACDHAARGCKGRVGCLMCFWQSRNEVFYGFVLCWCSQNNCHRHNQP